MLYTDLFFEGGFDVPSTADKDDALPTFEASEDTPKDEFDNVTPDVVTSASDKDEARDASTMLFSDAVKDVFPPILGLARPLTALFEEI